jgi:hypothetical protein
VDTAGLWNPREAAFSLRGSNGMKAARVVQQYTRALQVAMRTKATLDDEGKLSRRDIISQRSPE